MALFKPVRKPVIRQTVGNGSGSGALRPHYAPKAPPCTHACPIGTDVRGWIAVIADSEVESRTLDQSLENAWKKITARNPFPAVTGRICERPCEASCHRSRKDGAVAVRDLERFAGDYGISHGLKFPRAKALPERIAVLSAGPGGLSAAYHLARKGYPVMVFDAAEQPGGVMRGAGAEVLDAEIRRLIDLGVELRCNCTEPAPAFDAGFDAVLAADALERETLAGSIAQGMAEAEALIARLRGAAAQKPSARPPIGVDRIKLDWYDRAARPKADGAITQDSVVAQTKRCMSCGTCMACGNCWMYCSHGGFEKTAAGRRYRIKLDTCNGCRKCAEECPSGFIDME